MLKGKALKDFEEWYEIWFIENHKFITIEDRVNWFWKQPKQEQQGVLREFFESKGYELNINPFWENNYVVGYEYSLIIAREYLETCDEIFKDYSTAFTTAIQKACEIINGKGE